MFAYDFSSSPSYFSTFDLQPSKSIDISVFRLLPDRMRLSLEFARGIGETRPELGKFYIRGDWRKKAEFIELPEPGTPIKLLVRGDGKEVVYETLPAGSYTNSTIGRELVPFVDDGNPIRIPWPPKLSASPMLASGYSNFNVSILEVGQQLTGEKVTVVIHPPITLKSVEPNYVFLSWFILWPIFAILLVGYGGILFWKSKSSVAK